MFQPKIYYYREQWISVWQMNQSLVQWACVPAIEDAAVILDCVGVTPNLCPM